MICQHFFEYLVEKLLSLLYQTLKKSIEKGHCISSDLYISNKVFSFLFFPYWNNHHHIPNYP